MPTWDVTATLDEPAALVLGFVAHHLTMGAEQINLYWDAPPSPALAQLLARSRVRQVNCDAAYWRSVGGRPVAHVDRQIINANHAFAQCTSAWMLHCDADEVVSDGDALRRSLADAPSDINSLRLPTFERCFAPGARSFDAFDGIMRGAVPRLYKAAVAQTYAGDYGQMLTRGLSGYAGHKSLTRVGTDLAIGVHYSVLRDRNPAPHADIAAPAQHLNDVKIFHFDGVSPAHAAHKLLRKTLPVSPAALAQRIGSARYAQIAALQDGLSAEDLFTGLRQLTPSAASLLARFQLIVPQYLRPDDAAVMHWGKDIWGGAIQGVDLVGREPVHNVA